MKQRIQGIIIGILISALLFSTVVMAAPATVWKKIDVAYGDYKIYVDGELFEATDKNGKIESFSYNGWIFSPFEHIAKTLNKGVRWDGDTHSLYIYEKSIAAKEMEFSAGEYLVDRDILSGRYDIIWVSGNGNLFVYNANGRSSINAIFGGDAGSIYIKEYKNAMLESGGTFKVLGTLKVKFISK